MILESIISLDSDSRLAIQINEEIYSDLSKKFRKDFRQYIITTYNEDPNLHNNIGIKIDLVEELTMFSKYSGYNIDILASISDGNSKVEIRELTDIYVKDNGEIDLGDPYQDS
jgi:hypothetical protein